METGEPGGPGSLGLFVCFFLWGGGLGKDELIAAGFLWWG